MDKSHNEGALRTTTPTTGEVSGSRPSRPRRGGMFMRQTRDTSEAVEEIERPRPRRARSPTSKAFESLIEQRIEATHNGELETTYRIQACINIGMKLNWTKAAVLSLAKRTEQRLSAGDHLRLLFDPMWEVDAEVERLAGKNTNDFAWLKDIQARYCGTPGGHVDADGKVVVKWAPLMLMRVQAAINVAFERTFKEAAVAGEQFDISMFEHRSVFQFRVPGNETSEALDRLLRRSNTGQKRPNAVIADTALAPGIERRLRKGEKEDIAGSIIALDDGRTITETVLAVLDPQVEAEVINSRESVFETALRSFSDESWLVLDYFRRARRGSDTIDVTTGVPSRVVALKIR